MFRGCGGNGNRFDSSKECDEKCRFSKKTQTTEKEHKDMTLIVNACNISTDAKISEKVKSCDGGCPLGYNCNTEKLKCCPTAYHICRLETESGSEREAHKHYGRYSFVPGLNNCIRFSYFGLEGNFNNFLTFEACRHFCKSSIKQSE